MTLRHSGLHQPPLIAVRMTAAPVPVTPLHSVMLPVVVAITPVLFHEPTPVGAPFVVVPVMLITMVAHVSSTASNRWLDASSNGKCFPEWFVRYIPMF